jgi:hypothetical protein
MIEEAERLKRQAEEMQSRLFGLDSSVYMKK